MWITLYIQCVPKKWPPNVLLWQVQTCIALLIIKLAQALMYLDYCHQTVYKSIVPFSRFSIFTKCCQKGQLPAAQLTCFLCPLTVFCVNVQHLYIFSIGISSVWMFDFYWSCCGDKWYWFVLLEHTTAATSFASHSSTMWTFLHVSTMQCPGSLCLQNGCTAAVGQYAGLHRAAVQATKQPGSQSG